MTHLYCPQTSLLWTIFDSFFFLIQQKMAFILDDTHLEKLVCSECGKYLSVLPVKVYKRGITKCGRCCEQNDGGTQSLYRTLLKNSLFKCVNRYEQCNKLLTTSEVLKHEKDCFSNNYSCPKCEPNKFSGSAYDLLQHYKKQHPDSILEKNMFCVDARQTYKERYLHVKDNIIFFVLVENVCYGEAIYISVVSLIPYENIRQQFDLKLISKHKIKNIKTKVEPCCALKNFKCDYFKIDPGNPDLENLNKVECVVNLDLSDHISVAHDLPVLSRKPETKAVLPSKQQSKQSVQTIPPEDMPGVKLTDDFKKQYPDYKLTPCGTALFKPDGKRVELTCSNCRQFTGTNVFNCINNKHIMCWECKIWCSKCYAPMAGWNVELASMNELLLLPCRWKKCGLNFSGDGLRSHEATCLCNI